MKQALIALALLASASSASAANLVVNGGFETGDFSGWSSTGDTDGTFVRHTRRSGAWGAFLQTSNGYHHLDQSISTVAGHTYAVSFYLFSEQAAVGTANNFFNATFYGTDLVTFTNGPEFDYTPFGGTVTASSNSTLLAFNSRHPAGFFGTGFFALDDVDVTDLTPTGGGGGAVPEPASWAMMIVGFGAAGAMIRRRKAVLA